jgi:hypothetical protein
VVVTVTVCTGVPTSEVAAGGVDAAGDKAPVDDAPADEAPVDEAPADEGPEVADTPDEVNSPVAEEAVPEEDATILELDGPLINLPPITPGF